MCGIVGVVGIEASLAPDPVVAALMALAPRGPDGGGRHSGRLGPHPVVLASRRLALVDPSGGRQPFLRPSGSALVMNGEVYNHEELRSDLEARGEQFATRCDGEVLAAVLDRDGPAGLSKVEGSYAFAFLAAPAGPLTLGRDPSGVRPLCWARTARGIVLASTLDGLLATGLVAIEVDPAAVADVLRDGVVSGERTAVRGVHRVAPGEVLKVDGSLAVSRVALRWLPRDAATTQAGEPSTILDALRVAVVDRLRLDRPAGVFLSGGIDSALVAALAREVGRVATFTLTYPGHGDFDEARRAQRTARRLGLPHVEVPCPADPTSWVLGAARAFDEPFGDASAIPTWGLAKSAGTVVRAVLTGTGGDEVFGGYRRYWLLGTGPWLRHVPAFVRAPVTAVLDKAVPAGARMLRASADPEGLYRGLLRLQPTDEARALAGPAVRATLDLATAVAGPETPRDAMADDRVRYLPDDLLVKEDRALMAHGIEGRHPFLDRRVAAAASRVEIRGGVRRAQQKRVLRAYVREVIDPDLSAVAKHGFAFPADDLYSGPLCPLAEEVLTSRCCRERGLVSADATQRLLRDHLTGKRPVGAVVHALVMLELWARRVLDRAPL